MIVLEQFPEVTLTLPHLLGLKKKFESNYLKKFDSCRKEEVLEKITS